MEELDIFKLDDGLFGFAWANLAPRDRIKLLTDAPKTLWIFGAGASHHYNLNQRGVPIPLANGFFEAFQNLPTSEGFHAHVGPLISFLLNYRGLKPHELDNFSENIEGFMTSIEKEILELKEKQKSAPLSEDEMNLVFSLAPLFNNMNFIFSNVVNESQNGPSVSLYHYLLDYCGPNDTFVTFNWDTILDRALVDTGGWSPNDGYGISFTASIDGVWKDCVESAPAFPTKWKLLKLHGSTNWLVPYTALRLDNLEIESVLPNSDDVFLYWQTTLPYETFKGRWRGGYAPTCYCYYPPNLPVENFTDDSLKPSPDEEGKVRVSMSLRFLSPFKENNPGGVPSSPLLITPVRQKKYDLYQDKIESLWEQAAEEMNKADHINVIGYSFPETDVRPMELIRNVLKARKGDISIDLVSPDADAIAKRIGEEHLSEAKEVNVHSMKFEEYFFEVMQKKAPEIMRKAAQENQEVLEWVTKIYMMTNFAMEKYK